MKIRLLFIISIVVASAHTTVAQTVQNQSTASDATAPSAQAAQKAIVPAGKARFTVLTPRMIRMEWSDAGRFEDNATLAIINRRTDTPPFKVADTPSQVTITTDALTLTYRKGGRFSADNLQVEFTMNGHKVVWKPGMKPTGNLMGTARTLDQCEGDKLHSPMERGVLSRDGWAIIDESGRPILRPDNSRWGEWVAERSDSTALDWYMMAYGHDYKGALADFTKVAGKIPLPPRYAFGYWWSRYWEYSDIELRNLVETIRSLSIPIDVLVVDMDWHETWGGDWDHKDEFGLRKGWTGYTWNKRFFPSPANFLEFARLNNLRTSLNLHPASGIQPFEAVYDDFAAAYGWDTTGRHAIPFRIEDQKWADAYFKTVIHPMEHMGVSFWWLDWQQWLMAKGMPNLSNTFWLNYTFFRDMEINSDERPMIYHRWGGLGSHRYQVAFSGDTYSTWPTLAFLPYFTSTASNVCYGYWGHDIGGHMQRYKHTDGELYTRWMQYGVFTPIFKTHCTKSADIERRIWMFPDYFSALREAVRLRYDLVPYIYGAARESYDTGVSICRPMYYDYPEASAAYDNKEQYMFGDDILATCVAQPVDTTTGVAEREVWFPGGKWFDAASGQLIAKEGVRTMNYTVDENPYYVRAGAVIPMNPRSVMGLAHRCDTLALTVYPESDGAATYYEDAGTSRDYDKQFTTARIVHTTTATSTKVTIEPRQGGYDGMPATKSYEVRLKFVYPPKRVTVNGRVVEYARYPSQGGQWSYDGVTLTATIYVAPQPCSQRTVVAAEFEDYASTHTAKLYGKAGLFRRALALAEESKYESAHGGATVISHDDFIALAAAPSAITEDPQNIVSYLNDFDRNLRAMLETANSAPRIDPALRARLNGLLGE